MLAWIIMIVSLAGLFILINEWILTPMMENRKRQTVKVRYEDYVISSDGTIHYNHKKLDKHY